MSGRPRRIPKCLAAACLIAVCQAATDPPATDPVDEPHAANLITLNVVALNGHDDPVTDLNLDDFKLTDRGRPQKIVIFRRNETPALRQESPLAPHQFSNRQGPALPHVTILLLDVLNTPMTEQGYVRNQLVKTLQNLESGEFLYLYLLTPRGLFAVRGLPGVEAEPAGGLWTKDPAKLLDASFQRVMRMNPEMYPEDRVKLTFLSLEALAGRLATVAGRKNVVWFTRGIPIELGPNRTLDGDFVNYEPLVRQFSSTLQQANVAIYPVDDRAETLSRLAPAVQASGAGALATTPQDITSREGGLGSMETLQLLADLSGGRVNFSNDVSAAVRQALDDARFSYVIGYEPSADNWDGKFHKLDLKCARRGVRLQARRGYFAFSPAASIQNQQEASLESAASSPFDLAEIGLRVTVSPSTLIPLGTHFQIHLNRDDIVIGPKDGKFAGQFALSLFQYHDDGRLTTGPPTPLKLEVNADQFELAKKTGIDVVRDYAIDKDVSRIRLVLFDYGSKSVGSITLPISPQDRSPH